MPAPYSQFRKPFLGFKHLVGSVAVYKTNEDDNNDQFALAREHT